VSPYISVIDSMTSARYR